MYNFSLSKYMYLDRSYKNCQGLAKGY